VVEASDGAGLAPKVSMTIKCKHNRKGYPRAPISFGPPMPPGVFYDRRTGKTFDMREAYEGCKYDTVPVYTTFSEQARAWGLWAALKHRVPRLRLVGRLQVEWWKVQAVARLFRTTMAGNGYCYAGKSSELPQPERFLFALQAGVNAWRHYWD
jgi:hypothetical protein